MNVSELTTDAAKSHDIDKCSKSTLHATHIILYDYNYSKEVLTQTVCDFGYSISPQVTLLRQKVASSDRL